ncbi:MAG: glycosyltransferase [Chitinophagaceae bacterium]|nr:glycosyltransferase [Chitinophagaceae bacterium]
MTKHIIFTVTNDLAFDQRMQRICTSMVNAGYKVTLVGRLMPDSPNLPERPYRQIRLPLHYQKGKLFYIEYNFKLYRFLKKESMDAVCAIDLDTIIPVFLVSKARKLPRMYDAHEFFTEMIEVKRRPHIRMIWGLVERALVPRFAHGYTVSTGIAEEFKKLYGVQYALVRNMPQFYIPLNENTPLPAAVEDILNRFEEQTLPGLPFFLYQGAINEGRALPQLIDAMADVNARLLLAGSGNLEEEIRSYIFSKGAEKKVFMCGNVSPANLRHLTSRCYAGITIFDAYSKNQYYSLGNKFFDYIMAHKPQVCVNYPEYAAILEKFPVAVPMADTSPKTIAEAMNKLLIDTVLYQHLQHICQSAVKTLNWESEEKVLLESWEKLFLNGYKE